MIKLRDLLTEGDTIVKNKKTGNVYSVKTFNPAIHDKPTAADIQTAKAKNGGKIPTEKPAPTANIVNKPKDPTATPQNLQKLAQLKQQVAANNDDVDVSDYKTDGEGTVLYKGKKVADYVYSPNTDVFITKTPNGREYFDTQEDMFKYLQKNKEEEPKKQGVLSKMANMFAKKDSGIKEKTNRDTQIDKLSKEKEAIDKEWSEKYKKLSDAEFEKYDLPLQRKSNAIQKQMDDLEPSTISFGKKTQKAVSDWFDANKIPYELKAGSDGNTPELQFDSKDLPKDKVKELVQLAKHVQKKEKIGIDGDLDSTLYIKENTIKLRDLLGEAYNPAEAFNKKVSKMTDRNQHSEAAVELAIYLDDRDAVSKLNQIKKDHLKNGSITPADQKKRDEMVSKLLKKAKKELSEKDYKLINSSF